MSIDPAATIGAVHLTISDLARSTAFYESCLGLAILRRDGDTAYLGPAGGQELLALVERRHASRVRGTTGLYHFAILVPSRRDLATALGRLAETGTPLQGAADHGVSEALYLRDPDGNGIELYRDRPRDQWPRAADGTLLMGSQPLDLAALLQEAGEPLVEQAPPGPVALVETTRQRLVDLRTNLLSLHKVLLDDARAAYELDRGRVGSSANLLQLVINDPWFAWLHSLSELIVRIDEMTGKDAPTTEADATTLVEQVEKLLTASESGDGFQKRYYEALQRQPAVVLAHADVRRTLKTRRE